MYTSHYTHIHRTTSHHIRHRTTVHSSHCIALHACITLHMHTSHQIALHFIHRTVYAHRTINIHRTTDRSHCAHIHRTASHCLRTSHCVFTSRYKHTAPHYAHPAQALRCYRAAERALLHAEPARVRRQHADAAMARRLRAQDCRDACVAGHLATGVDLDTQPHPRMQQHPWMRSAGVLPTARLQRDMLGRQGILVMAYINMAY